MFYDANELCQHLPWCVTDPKKLGQVVTEFTLSHQIFVKQWAQKWVENQQFIYGNHNVKWSRKYEFAVDTDFLSRKPTISRQSQTNITRVVAEALSSLIYSDLPRWVAETMEESSSQGKRFRSICQKLLDCYMQRLNMDVEFKNAAFMYVAYGQFCYKVKWDANAGRIRQVPQFEKKQIPIYRTGLLENGPFGVMEAPEHALNSEGQPMYDTQWVPVTDDLGRQVIENQWTGDVGVDVLSPFEYLREPGSAGMHKAKWIQQYRLMDFDDWLAEYGNIEGKTSLFGTIKPGEMDRTLFEFAFKQHMRLSFLTPSASKDGNFRRENALSFEHLRHKVIVIEHYDKPHNKKWPRGRRVIVTNGVCTHMTTPDYSTNKKDGWHPFVEASWMNVAPSSMAAGPLNDVVQKNKELNSKDSLIYTATLRNMGSQLLVKAGQLDPNDLTGTPGAIHEVPDPQTAAKWLHDEQPIPAVINQLRQQDKDDVYEVSGAGEALRGERSKNVSAGYALRQLQEREERRLTPPRKHFEVAVSGLGEKIIACLKANAVGLDDQVVGFLKRSASGEFTIQDVVAFLKTPIDYGVDVRIEAGSMAYQSKATMQATLMDLMKGPAAGLLQNPKVMDNVLKYFEAEMLRDPVSKQRDRASRENEVFADILKFGPTAKVAAPLVMFEDVDEVHIEEHTEWAVEHAEELMSNPLLLHLFTLHIETHKNNSQEKRAEIPVGTTQATPQQFAQVQAQQPKPMQQIYFQQQQKVSQPPPQAAAPQAAPAGQAPTQPNPPGVKGPRQVNPAAPSAQTPQGQAGARKAGVSPTQGGVSV
jgi:hypothetical protein